jgi:flagellar biosynthesis/type III secretory pathway protein FliH
MYLPHYFKENLALVQLGMQHMDETTMRQYQEEERSLLANRFRTGYYRIEELFKVMEMDEIAPEEKVKQLGKELSAYHKNPAFKNCKTMGQLVLECLNQVVEKRLG